MDSCSNHMNKLHSVIAYELSWQTETSTTQLRSASPMGLSRVEACAMSAAVDVSKVAVVESVCSPVNGNLPCNDAGGYAVGVADISTTDESFPMKSFAGL